MTSAILNMATGGFINGIDSVHQSMLVKPLIWEVRNFLLDDFSNSEHGHWWFYQWDSLCSPIHVGQRPLIWEVRNFLLDDFSNSDFELNKLQLLRRHLLHLLAF